MCAWEMERIGNCTLYRGDCRDVVPTLSGIDAVVTDPPYGVGLKGKRAYMGHGSAITTVRPGTYSHPDTPEYVKSVVVPVIVQLRDQISCVVVTPGTRCYWLYPPPDDLGCFFHASGHGMGRWGFTCMQPILYYGKDPYQREGLGCRPNACGQTYPNDANTHQFVCAKPLPMLLWLVNRASLEDETVCDPFMGSGTTGVACVQLGRSFVGIEIDTGTFDLACTRITEACAQPDMFRFQRSTVEQLAFVMG
jgi:site-specific DNA-methyltransferase (adenine-specific)